MSHACLNCGEDFTPRPNVPGQKYCGSPGCRRARRAQWQREKLSQDPDYREHQEKAKRNWRGKRRDYMREYRRNHPEYCERDREKRKERRRKAALKRKGRGADGAGSVTRSAVNMDSYGKTVAAMESGYYRICPVGHGSAVNMDLCAYGSVVQLIVVAADAALSVAPQESGCAP